MADQPQTGVDPFVQQYGQLRLAPMDTSKGMPGTSQDTKIAAGGSGKSPVKSGPSSVDPTKPNVNPAVAASTNDKTKGGSLGQYLGGAAAVGGAAAGAYAIKRYLNSRTGKMVEEIVPVAGVTGKGGLPDPLTRPNWRYDGVQVDPQQLNGSPGARIANGQNTQANGAGLQYNPRGQGQQGFPETPDVVTRPGAPQLALPNPNGQPTGPIYAGQSEQPLMITDQNAAGRAKAAAAETAGYAQRLAQKFRVTGAISPEAIRAIGRVVK